MLWLNCESLGVVCIHCKSMFYAEYLLEKNYQKVQTDKYLLNLQSNLVTTGALAK